ncbi:hypothetical protein PQR75_46510 [Paraburkholderia fungorum]
MGCAALDVLLLDGFNWHEAHGGPARGLDDRLCIVAIVPVRLDERRDVLRADQPDFNSH